MKRLVIGAVIVGAMAGQLPAQSNFPERVVVLSVGGAPLAPGTFSLNLWSDPPCDRPQAPRHGDNRFPYWGYACDPIYAGNNGYGYSAPSVTVAIPQVVAPSAPMAPPTMVTAAPIRSEVREYHWPSSANDSTSTTFSIISKDGRVQSASIVWVQDNALCYVTPEGSHGKMPIDSIDRQATRQRNAENEPNSWLPAGD